MFKWLNSEVQKDINSLPNNYEIALMLFVYTLFIIIYILFIWKFYKFISKRNIFSLKLNSYNKSEHPKTEKSLAIIFYFLEYILILPFLVIFWFTVLSLFLLLLASPDIIETNIDQILFVSASIIISTRVMAYINEEVSKEYSRIFSFCILAIFILSNSFFNFDLLYKKISYIPLLFNQSMIFTMFIFVIELASRITYSINQIFVMIKPSEQNFKNLKSKRNIE